ncbi:MAG: PQQ-binding-like beta-propeller repeat protein [Bacteroidales bacterium]|nr:PQQ-binding-like beta-propeller repeat protein [Bacteroidales bacterium]
MIKNIKTYRVIIPAVIILLFSTAFVWFLRGGPGMPLEERVPGQDNRPELIEEGDPVIIGEFFEVFAETGTVESSNWPHFRGPGYDNIASDGINLPSSFPENGPPIVWEVKLGEGHAAASVHDGRVYVLDYNEKIRADALRCFSLETGEELWRRWYNVPIKRNHGMSRSIPTVSGDYVVSMGPRCHVMCLNPESGDLYWTLDLVADYGAEIPQWYTAQCPLIDGDIAVLAVGGESLLMGVDCRTGEVVWETPNPDKWKMSHSSIIPMTIHGVKTYVYMAVGGICGVAAEGENRGEILWKTSEWNPAVIAPSPVYIGNGEIAFTAGYGAGGGKLKVYREGSGFTARVIEAHSPREGMASEQQTPIVYGEYLWTIHPKDAGEMRMQLACYHVSDLTNPVWASGKENRFGLGPFIVINDKMLLANDEAELFLFDFRTNSVNMLDHHIILEEGIDSWGPFAYADGYLIMRDSYTMICLDIRAQGGME